MKGQFIYKIINTINNKFYVGSTTNTKERFRVHRTRLRANRHHSKHLQAAWNKYGEDAFVFHVIQTIPEGESLQEAENVWLFEHVGKDHCYNKSRYSDTPMRGIKKEDHPNFGRPKTEEERQAISAKLKDFYAKDITNHPRFGKQHSLETKELIRQKKLANPTRAWLGKHRSEETKLKLSLAQKGRPNPRKGAKMSEQGRLNVAAAVKKGSESHFFGKRPANADDLQKAIVAVKPDRSMEEFKSLSSMRDTTGITLATIIRACKTGLPISKGKFSGWVLSYKGQENKIPEIPEEYAHLPRSRSQAKAEGAKHYFTGLPCERGHVGPRATKGTCIMCRREEEKKAKKLLDTATNQA
jgi:group I intron endonuclease